MKEVLEQSVVEHTDTSFFEDVFQLKIGTETNHAAVRLQYENGLPVNFLITPDFDIYASNEEHETVTEANGISSDVDHGIVKGYLKKEGSQGMKVTYYEFTPRFADIFAQDDVLKEMARRDGRNFEQIARDEVRRKLEDFFIFSKQ